MAIADLVADYETTETIPEALAEKFEDADPQLTLAWALQEFGSQVATATGFGAEGCVIIDMLSKIDPHARIFYLDTDLFFPETYQLMERLKQRYGVTFERRATSLSLEAQAKQYGEKLWERQPAECCRLRKVEPLIETLAGLRAWISGIRRDQSPARANAAVVERDRKFGLIKINPLVGWNSIAVWKYIVKHDVPYNPLHDRGFPSIGCIHCTTPVRLGEGQRAGRWREQDRTECGLHQ
jgi:phosphoadenosine phosphosulfate reductase